MNLMNEGPRDGSPILLWTEGSAGQERRLCNGNKSVLYIVGQVLNVDPIRALHRLRSLAYDAPAHRPIGLIPKAQRDTYYE